MSKVVFWSSVDASAVLSALIKEISDHGLIAEHKFIISAESYRNSNSTLCRVILRFRMYIEYPIRLMLESILDRRPRIYIVTTNTFFAPLIAIAFSNSNQKVINLVWDLYPDLLVGGNAARLKSPFMALLSKLVGMIFSRASANVFLGERLLSYARSRFPMISNAHVIPVGGDDGLFVGDQFRIIEDNKPIDILYCGNLGAMHDVDTLLGTLDSEVLLNGNFKISFNASGPNYSFLRDALKNEINYPFKNICLGEPLTNVAWRARMFEAQVALITLKPNAERFIMPSKLYSALVFGQAILAVCTYDSDLATLICENDCGWVVEPGHSDQLQDALLEITTNAGLLNIKRQNALKAGRDKYSAQVIAKEWVRLYNLIEKN